MIPFFVDRLADQYRILDPQIVFEIGIVLSSFVYTEIQIPDEQPPPKVEETQQAQNDQSDVKDAVTANGIDAENQQQQNSEPEADQLQQITGLFMHIF